MLHFEMKHPQATQEMLGYIPTFLSENNLCKAREQLDANYRHGGGWNPFQGHRMLDNGNIQYPGDPPNRLLAEAKLRDEVIRIYENAWVAIIQADSSFEIARMD